MQQWDVIETRNNILLHHFEIGCALSGPITILDSFPVLFNEIQFTMEFRVEITDVTAGCDVFFKLRFLQNKVGLSEHGAVATAVSVARCTFEAMALSIEPIFQPLL